MDADNLPGRTDEKMRDRRKEAEELALAVLKG